MNESCRISEKLIAIIQENGPEYPEREPFQVYLALMKDHVTNHKIAEALADYLDEIFDDYCTCAPDYPPAVEDFDIDDYIEEWCENNRFEFQSSTGHGMIVDMKRTFNPAILTEH